MAVERGAMGRGLGAAFGGGVSATALARETVCTAWCGAGVGREGAAEEVGCGKGGVRANGLTTCHIAARLDEAHANGESGATRAGGGEGVKGVAPPRARMALSESVGVEGEREGSVHGQRDAPNGEGGERGVAQREGASCSLLSHWIRWPSRCNRRCGTG